MPLTKVASSMLASGASGSGSSLGKNYISTYNNNTCNGDFETGSTTGWLPFTVSSITNGLPSGLNDGSGAGAGTVALTPINVGQIAGAYSMQTVFPATANQGLITNPFTIDTEDQAKVMTFKFYYNVTAGAGFANFSGTSTNTFIVAVYAVNGTNVGWLQPAGVYSMTQSSGGSGYATGTFQTYSDTTQYRFAILCATVPLGSVTVVFDDFYLGPQTAPYGPVVTDWVDESASFSVSGDTGATKSIFTRRMGDTLFIRGTITASASVAATTFSIDLPAKYKIDYSKSTTTANVQIVGNSTIEGATLAAFTAATAGVTQIFIDGTTTGSIFAGYQYNGNTLSKNTASSFLSAGNKFSFLAEIPIQGWSANVQMSNDTDTRVVAASAYNSGTVTTSVTPSPQPIPFTTITYDTHGALFIASGKFTVPVSGFYNILLNGWVRSSGTGNTIFVYKNGSSIAGIFSFQSAGTGHSGSIQLPANAGDYFDIRTDGAYNITGVNVSFSRVSGPSVIAATESVVMSAYLSANALVDADAVIFWDTKEFDSHSAYSTSTGKFTAPVSGTYRVSTWVYGSNPGINCTFFVWKNNVKYKPLTWQNSGSNTGGSFILKLNAGDAIDMRPDRGAVISPPSPRIITGGPLNTLNCSYFEVARVGN